jgi:hypothetical protein
MSEPNVARRRDGKSGLEFVEARTNAYSQEIVGVGRKRRRTRFWWLIAIAAGTFLTVLSLVSHPVAPRAEAIEAACKQHAAVVGHLDTSAWGEGVFIEQPGHFDMRGPALTGEWVCWGLLDPIEVLGSDVYPVELNDR